MRVLITGVAGFIGSHLARTLLDRGHRLIGIENVGSSLADDAIFA